MKSYDIAVVGGDGIGPEVVAEECKVLTAVAAQSGFQLNFTNYDLGGERYLQTGELLPEPVLAELMDHDAILLGAIGTPTVPVGVLERGITLALRTRLDQYVNLRPIRLLPGAVSAVTGLTSDRCDLVVLRENIEGLYGGAGGTSYGGTPAEVATQESINTYFGVERLVRYGFELAQTRRGHLTLCHKTNVLGYAGSLWARVVDDVATEYPEVQTDYVHVDAACLYFVTQPERFDVIVTDSMFGDIITDLGAAVTGGIGLSASASINPGSGVPGTFEPIHGSAPDIAGQGIANPIGAILAGGLCLEHLGEIQASLMVEEAVILALQRDETGMTDTTAIGDLITQETERVEILDAV
ncbi:MAG: 3-isopropylmalate dehydrogenase [Acidimicrobiia bacterium]|nr:MAG: 3-isopropylmalate dehydrogenase [Acidimicrobiia bacterium]